MAHRDTALEAFDQLRVQEVNDWGDDTASFLAKLQSTTASLKPEERITLVAAYARKSVEMLKVVLSDPQASKVCALDWWYNGMDDVNSIVPLLISNCPELASLRVHFEHHSALDFVSSVLEHPSNKIKVLEMPRYKEGDSARFFAALGQSQVSALTLYNHGFSEFARGLCDYLAKDLLVKLKVTNYERVPSEVIMSLAKCTLLANLEMRHCEFAQPTVLANLPKSFTKLVFYDCTFVRGFDWSFLAGSSVQELDLSSLIGVDGNQLGSALAVLLRAKGLDKLHFCDCDFAGETLAAAGVEIVRIKRLILERSDVDGASVELIALALRSPNSELRELKLEYNSHTTVSIENHLVPALRHPNCNLVKLSFRVEHPEHSEAAFRVDETFRNRRALFALLQGQQVKRKSSCQLRRLPVEMFRLVGKVLV